jgi:hypothetical protein
MTFHDLRFVQLAAFVMMLGGSAPSLLGSNLLFVSPPDEFFASVSLAGSVGDSFDNGPTADAYLQTFMADEAATGELLSDTTDVPGQPRSAASPRQSLSSINEPVINLTNYAIPVTIRREQPYPNKQTVNHRGEIEAGLSAVLTPDRGSIFVPMMRTYKPLVSR